MEILKQTAIPALVAFVVAAMAGIAARWIAPRWARLLLAVIAVGGGYAAGHAKATGWPAFPPLDATHWLLFSACASIPIGFAYGWSEQSWKLRGSYLVVLVAGTLALLLKPRFQFGPVGEASMGAAFAAIAALLTAFSLQKAVQRTSKPWSLFWLLILCGATSAALMLSGSALLGQLAAVLACTLFASILAAFLGSSLQSAVIPATATLFAGLLAAGYFYAELPKSSGMLLMAAPGLALLPPGESTLRKEIIRFAMVAIPSTLAVFLAFRASPSLEY